MLVTGFKPITDRGALVLILGTLPGGESLGLGEYYADRTNAFWDVMGSLFGARRSLPYEERVRIVSQDRVAIWDVLRSADRASSIDTAVVKGTEVANDFNSFFLDHSSVRCIFFNGRRSQGYYQSLVMPGLTPPASTLPQYVLHPRARRTRM